MNKKIETKSLVFKQKLTEFKHSKLTGIDIYTDGLKDNKRCAENAINLHFSML